MSKIIIASGPVIVEDNKVLLDKDSKDNFWKFCGGKVADYEADIKETAKRRVKEEMGLDVEILSDEPYFFYTEKAINGEKTSIILAHFLAKRLNDVSMGLDTVDFKWVDINELDNEILAPNIIPALKHFTFLK